MENKDALTQEIITEICRQDDKTIFNNDIEAFLNRRQERVEYPSNYRQAEKEFSGLLDKYVPKEFFPEVEEAFARLVGIEIDTHFRAGFEDGLRFARKYNL